MHEQPLSDDELAQIEEQVERLVQQLHHDFGERYQAALDFALSELEDWADE
jgi:hypothetical protein